MNYLRSNLSYVVLNPLYSGSGPCKAVRIATVKLVQLANLGLPATMHTLDKSGTKWSKKSTGKENTLKSKINKQGELVLRITLKQAFSFFRDFRVETELHNPFPIKPPKFENLMTDSSQNSTLD